jgi:hypothetical protein
MKYPNLIWALSQFGPRYRFAALIGESESWLSRRVIGRIPFSTADRERMAAVLGYPAAWLFAEPAPPCQDEKEAAQVEA